MAIDTDFQHGLEVDRKEAIMGHVCISVYAFTQTGDKYQLYTLDESLSSVGAYSLRKLGNKQSKTQF